MTTMEESKIKPFIPCNDYWPVQIPQEKMNAYKELIAEGQISDLHIIYNTNTGATCIEYRSIAPHEWIRKELMRRA